MDAGLSLAVVILLALLFSTGAARAWRMRHPVARVIGGIAASALTLLFILIAGVALLGIAKLNTGRSTPAPVMQATASTQTLALGERRSHMCAGCHSTTNGLPLDGSRGNFFAEDEAQTGSSPFGTMAAPNLTPGGPVKDWTDGEIVRAIREGVDNHGKPLIVMPSQDFHAMSDADALALVAYLRSQPAIVREQPDRSLSLLGLLILGSGQFPTSEQPAITQPALAPPPGVTTEYGKYLVDSSGCASCHGADLAGKQPGGLGPPAGPNLTAIVPRWSQDEFVRFIRTGTDPAGHQVDPKKMPWQAYDKMYADEELAAIYTYLRGLPPLPGPNEPSRL